MHNLQNRTLDSLLDSVSVKWRPGEIRPLLSARGSTVKSDSSYSFRFKMRWRARQDSNLRPPGSKIRSTNPKCCFWCRLQGNAPFISLLSWTEVGLKCLNSKVVDAPFE
jgi:hypothetical protein